MPSVQYTFANPSSLREFLVEIGAPETEIQTYANQTQISRDKLEMLGVNNDIFFTIASQEEKKSGSANSQNIYVSDSEIDWLNREFQKPNSVFPILLKNTECTSIAKEIFLNLYGDIFFLREHGQFFGVDYQPTSCNFQDLLDQNRPHNNPKILRGVLFQDSQMSSEWQRAGAAVVELKGYKQSSYPVFSAFEKSEKGSGVVISPQGHILTAAHVVASLVSPENSDAMEELTIGNETYLLSKDDILFFDTNKDIAILKISKHIHGQNFPYSKFSIQPATTSDSYTAIGFPGLLSKESRRLYTTGQFLGLAYNHSFENQISSDFIDPIPPSLETDIKLDHGFSGGGLFDPNYNLVGINLAISETEENKNISKIHTYHFDIFAEIEAQTKLGVLLAQIQSLQ